MGGSDLLNKPTAKDFRIDRRVARLVSELNKIPGMLGTYSSCGGHRVFDQNFRPGSEPFNEFFVCFNVYRSSEGWYVLEIIAWAASQATFDVLSRKKDTGVRLFAWNNTDSGDSPPRGSLSFELRGKRIHPDRVAEYLESFRLRNEKQ